MGSSAVRITFLIGFIITVALLAFAGYLQVAQGLTPCPLCQMQRFALAFTGLFFLLAAIHNPSIIGVKIYSVLIIIFSAIGASLAGRQIWLQANPPLDSGACGVGLDYLINVLPLSEALKLAVLGSGDCAEVHWQFLGLSIPGWTLIFFILLILIGFLQIFRVRRRRIAIGK